MEASQLVVYTSSPYYQWSPLRRSMEHLGISCKSVDVRSSTASKESLRKLTRGSLTTPRMFLNDQEVDAETLHQQLRATHEDVLPSSLPPVLISFDVPPRTDDDEPEEIEQFHLLDEALYVIKYHADLDDTMPSQIRRWRGYQLVSFFMRRYSLMENSALELCQALRRKHYIIEAEDVPNAFRDDETEYAFLCEFDPMALNMHRRVSPHIIRDYVRLSQTLRTKWLNVVARHAGKSASSTWDGSVCRSKAYVDYRNHTAYLQHALVHQMSPGESTAFFLNVLLCLIGDAMASLGAAMGKDGSSIYHLASYVIGKQKYSIADIEHGVLRANRPPPGMSEPRFAPEDMRVVSHGLDTLVESDFDPRIHFALAMGGRWSSRTVPVFTPSTIEEDLQYVTEAYLSEFVHVDVDASLVMLPPLFLHYLSDFTETEKTLLRWLVPNLPMSMANALNGMLEDSSKHISVCYRESPRTPAVSIYSLPSHGESNDPLVVPSKDFSIIVHHSTISDERLRGLPKISTAEAYATMRSNHHTDHVGKDIHDDPVVLSMCVDKVGRRVEILMRTCEERSYSVVGTTNMKVVWDHIAHSYNIPPEQMVVVGDASFSDQLTVLEEETKASHEFKCGVLYYADGQREENAIFGNVEGSDEFTTFINAIGTRVRLKGYQGYAAGLDTNNDKTGEYSIRAIVKDDVEIMFHVATMIPFDSKDEEQIVRKRHIGNDSIVVVFHDGTTPFNPSVITSKYIQIFVYVRVERLPSGKALYRVQLATREGLELSPSLMKVVGVSTYTNVHTLSASIHKIVIEGRECVYKAPSFRQRIRFSNLMKLSSLVEAARNGSTT